MSKNLIKDWTILIYADGNNELEPEIWRSKIDAEKIGSSDTVNVIMQIARESNKLVKYCVHLTPYQKQMKFGQVYDVTIYQSQNLHYLKT